MAKLQLQNLSHQFGNIRALNQLSLQVDSGKILTLLGPSGCGKTTTIRLIAGLLKPSSGKIIIDEQDITSLPPEKRNIGMVFQSYALFPHLNVFENVAFGLKARGYSTNEIKNKVEKALSLVNLSSYHKRAVFKLSGGEQQRVSVARAVVIEPKLLLLDEPLSNLDAGLREQTRSQLSELIHQLHITTIFVTHDQEEAFAFSDRVALLSEGTLQQIGTAQELYFRPANHFVANFIGKSNIWELPLKSHEEAAAVFKLPSGMELCISPKHHPKLKIGEYYKLLLRPENVQLEETSSTQPLFSAQIISQRFMGANIEFVLKGEGLTVLVLINSSLTCSFHKVGNYINLFLEANSIYIIPSDKWN